MEDYETHLNATCLIGSTKRNLCLSYKWAWHRSNKDFQMPALGKEGTTGTRINCFSPSLVLTLQKKWGSLLNYLLYVFLSKLLFALDKTVMSSR